MKKIKVSWTSTDAVNVRGQDVIEVADDATEDEIEEAARDVAFEHLDWWYEEADE